MKNFYILLISFFLVSCSASKQYYTPENTKILPSIKLKNDKEKNTQLKDYDVINSKNNIVYLSNDLGFLKILKNNEIIFDNKFDAKIVSIETYGNKAAMVDALNNIILYDLYNYEYILSQSYGIALGVIKPIQNPKFTDKIIMVPTLDGKLVVINNQTNKIIRALSVGNLDFFNNILFFDATDEKLIAASSSKIITILENKSNFKIINIKKVASFKDFIYVFSNEGFVYKYDYSLNELKKVKFKYANFKEAYAYNSFLYVVENGGYLIKLDEDLNEIAVFKLDGKIQDKVYFENNILFYDDKTYQLQ